MREIIQNTRVRAAGFYRMHADAYHADPCPDASLSQSIAKLLIDQSPMHAWHAHPKLNPAFEPDRDKKFDLGTAAHRIIIGQGRDVIVIPFDDYRKEAARACRDEALKTGHTPILKEQYDRVMMMVEAFHIFLDRHGLAAPFREGEGEVCIAAPDETTWLRSLVDWIEADGLTFDDYKTTDRSVAPHAIDRYADDSGWNVQAAMQDRILDLIEPESSGRRTFKFFAQEAYAPFACTVGVLGKDCLAIGHRKVQYAVDRWNACLKSGEWPSYEPAIVQIMTPEFSEKRWLDRELREAEGK